MENNQIISAGKIPEAVLTDASSNSTNNKANSYPLPNTSTNMRQKIEQAIENDNISNIEVKSINQLSKDYGVDKKSAEKIVEQKDKLDTVNDKLENIESKIEKIEKQDPQNKQKIKKLKKKRKSLVSTLKDIYTLVNKFVDEKIISPLKSILRDSDAININESFFERPARVKKIYYFHSFSSIILLGVFKGFGKLFQSYNQHDKHNENNVRVSVADKNPSEHP